MPSSLSGNLKDLAGVASVSGLSLRFTLQGTAGQQPRVSGTGLIVPQQIDFTPNASGVVSGTLYSTRDAAGTGNGEIEVGGSLTSVWYKMEVFVSGIPQAPMAVHARNGITLDISTVTPISTTPVATAPTGDTTYARLDGGNQPFTAAITAPTVNAGRLNYHIYVDGTKYPITQVGIQQAFTDACAISNGAGVGTHVWLPPCAVTLTNTTLQQFLITAPIQVHGCGPNATWFVIGGSVPNTVPCFRIKPSGSQFGWAKFEQFRITSGGSFGGDAFFLDSTSGPVNHFTMHALDIQGLDNASWSLNMTAGVSNQFFFGRVTDCNLQHGIKLNNSTDDSWQIRGNTFGSATGGTTPAIDVTTQSGASHIEISANNGGCTGGFLIAHGGTEIKVLYNQIEQPAASTEANSAIIDIIGDSYSIDAAEIRGNNIGSNNFATNCIRIGTATNTIIAGNVLGIKATTGVGIALTASSSGTKIDGTNEFIGVGGGAVAMTNATGVNPFTLALPTATGTLPATVTNDTAGGISLTTNAGNLWQILNTGPLRGPAGLPVTLQGASAGSVNVIAPLNAGGTFTPLDINSGSVAKATVASDFTTANNTNLQTITGLSFTVLANVKTLNFHAAISYSQATANAVVAFGIQVATNAPTNVFANGVQQITQGPPATFVTGTLATLTTTTATNIVSGLPGAVGNVYTATLDGTIELPNSACTINIMVSTANGADAVTVKRGSYVELF